MAFDWAEQRQKTRRAVHNTFGVTAFYSDSLVVSPRELKVRLHDAIGAVAVQESRGVSDIIEHITQVVFDAEQLAEEGIAPQRGGVVRFPQYGQVYVLDSDWPTTGPIDVVWTVIQQ